MVNQILISQDKKNFKNINLGNYVLNISEQTLISKTYKKISLTDIEFKIFVKLAQHNNEYVKKDEVLTKVWGKQNSYKTHTLETHIYRIRKKLNSIGAKNYEIRNIDNSYICSTSWQHCICYYLYVIYDYSCNFRFQQI